MTDINELENNLKQDTTINVGEKIKYLKWLQKESDESIRFMESEILKMQTELKRRGIEDPINWKPK